MSSNTIYVQKIKEISVDNKYTKYYINLINKAYSRIDRTKSLKNQKQQTIKLTHAASVENHHILPKCFKLGGERDKDNLVYLTSKEHYIAHLLLRKMFIGFRNHKMCIAFNLMNKLPEHCIDVERKMTSNLYEFFKSNNIKSKQVCYYRLTEVKRVYVDDIESINNLLRLGFSKNMSKEFKTKYYTENPNIQGHKRSKEQKNKVSGKNSVLYKPNKFESIYFLDMKIIVDVRADTFPLYLDQGWSLNITKEYKTKLSIDWNKNMSSDARQRAGENISLAIRRKIDLGVYFKKASRDTIIKMRTNKSGILRQPIMYYNTILNIFENIDPIYDDIEISTNYIRVFTKGKANPGRMVWDIDGNKFTINKLCPIVPNDLYEKYPFELVKVYNKDTKNINLKLYKDVNLINEIIIKSPNGGRIKLKCSDIETGIYVNKDFIAEYGIPLNCTY